MSQTNSPSKNSPLTPQIDTENNEAITYKGDNQ